MFILIIPGVTKNNKSTAARNQIFIILFVISYFLLLKIASNAPIKNNGKEYQYVSPYIIFPSCNNKIFIESLKLFILLIKKSDENKEQFP